MPLDLNKARQFRAKVYEPKSARNEDTDCSYEGHIAASEPQTVVNITVYNITNNHYENRQVHQYDNRQVHQYTQVIPSEDIEIPLQKRLT